MGSKGAKITAAVIRAAIAARWRAPEYAVMFEVGNATGAAVRRHADAVIMSLWPSRGLELHGVEIKVSRADWKREAADPQKAEEIARFCDRWWVITAPGVIDDLSDVPPAWGVREFDGKRWKTLREAEITEAEPVSRDFLGAMLRRADTTMREDIRQAAKTAIADAEAAIEKRVATAIEQRTRDREGLHKVAEKIRAEFGIDIRHFPDDRDFASAVRLGLALVENGIGCEGWSGVTNYLDHAAGCIDKARKAIAALANPEGA